jgi:hypothetical protein
MTEKDSSRKGTKMNGNRDKCAHARTTDRGVAENNILLSSSVPHDNHGGRRNSLQFVSEMKWRIHFRVRLHHISIGIDRYQCSTLWFQGRFVLMQVQDRMHGSNDNVHTIGIETIFSCLGHFLDVIRHDGILLVQRGLQVAQLLV